MDPQAREPFALDREAIRAALDAAGPIIRRTFAVGDKVGLIVSPDGGKHYQYVMTEVTGEDPTAKGYYELRGYAVCGLHSSSMVPADEVQAWERSGRVPWLWASPVD